MRTIKLTIPGKPIAKKRPRFVRKGNYVSTYSDQATESGKAMLLISSQLKEHQPIEGAVGLEINFFMPIPKSTSKKKMELMEQGIIQHVKKPDLDNLEKFISDCLNGLAWKDDSQIVWSHTSKYYDNNPRTEITIIEITKL